ncbi:MAG: DUF1887 family CARF protein [Giesbergeria sp.]
MSNTLHLCIATGQNAANFIPLKQLQAQDIWVLETPEMQQQHSAKALATALKAALPNAQIRILPFDDSTPQAMQAAALQLASDELDGKDVVFHATGGTKLMVLAIHQQLLNLAAGQGRYRLLYADTAHQTLSWLDEQARQEPMADVLTLQEQLLLRGYRTSNDTRPAGIQQRASERAKTTRFMGEKSAQLKGFFSKLNYQARQAADGKGLTRELDYLPRGAAGNLLEMAQEHGLLSINEAYSQITFASQDIAEYLCGGWVEEYVFLKFTGTLAPSQYTLGAQLTHIASKTQNEIDGIAVAHNRALIVECKAKKQDQAQDAIYKLGQLVRQVGGLMARGLYVSARSVSDADRSRAREYGVDVLAGEDLAQLSDYLRRWKSDASAA